MERGREGEEGKVEKGGRRAVEEGSEEGKVASQTCFPRREDEVDLQVFL